MPITNTVDDDKKLIYTTCHGVMTPADFDEYIHNIWSHDKYFGYNELFDTVEANWDDFNFSYLLDVSSKAAQLNTIDPDSRLAWVVLEGKQKQLTDFYKAAKSMASTKSRALEAFYSRDEALNWLNS